MNSSSGISLSSTTAGIEHALPPPHIRRVNSIITHLIHSSSRRERSLPERAYCRHGKGYRLTSCVVFFATLLTFIPITSCNPGSKKSQDAIAFEPLRLFIWEDSIPQEVLSAFERETGIPVKADYYSQLEVLVDSVRHDPARYDLIAPSDYAVKALADQSLLAHLPANCDKLRGAIDQRFNSPWYDPALQVCLPFQWSLSAVAYNKKHIPSPPESWAELLDPVKAKSWAGRMSLLDDAREVLGIALLANGQSSPYTIDITALEAAASKVREIMPNVARLDSERFEDGLISGALWVAHGFNGDLARAKLHNPDLEYFIPREGAILSVDNLAIPSGSRKIPEAVRFMEYILRPEISRQITAAQGLASTLAQAAEAKDALPLSDKIVYGLPPPDKTFSLKARGSEAPLEDKLWRDIRNF